MTAGCRGNGGFRGRYGRKFSPFWDTVPRQPGPTARQFVINGLSEDTRYAVKVRACNRHGWGPWSQRSEDMNTKPLEEPDGAAGGGAAAAAATAATDGGDAPAPGSPPSRLRSQPTDAAAADGDRRTSFFLGGSNFAKELAHRAALAIGLEEEDGATGGGAPSAAAAAADAAPDGSAPTDAAPPAPSPTRELMGAAGLVYKDVATREVAHLADNTVTDALRSAVMAASLAFERGAKTMSGLATTPTTATAPRANQSAADTVSTGDLRAVISRHPRLVDTRRSMCVAAQLLCVRGRESGSTHHPGGM